jgi:hypothetical protein
MITKAAVSGHEREDRSLKQRRPQLPLRARGDPAPIGGVAA